MRINHNMMAMNAHRQLGVNNGNTAKAIEKLSSGLRINRAGDDAAGLAISEKMRGQIRGLNKASRNAQDGISMIQTAEGALTETHAILQRMRELAVQSSNDTNTGDDRKELQKEINQLIDEIDRIGNQTEFNGQKLINGDKTTDGVKLQIGANKGQDLNMTMTDMRSTALEGESIYTLEGSALTAKDLDIDFAGKTLTFTVNGKDVDVDLASIGDHTKATTGTDSDQTQTDALGQQIADLVNNAGIGVTMSVDTATHKMSFTSADQNAVLKTDGTTKTGVGTATKGTEAKQTLDSLKIANPTATSTGGVMTHDDAMNSIATIDNAIKQVSSERSKFGAYQNRLEHTIKNLDTSSENLQAAESRIRDVDMAKEMMAFTKNNILQQAAQSMLAQANQQPQGVLQLLR